jgi:hypothetical protein
MNQNGDSLGNGKRPGKAQEGGAAEISPEIALPSPFAGRKSFPSTAKQPSSHGVYTF